MVFKFCYLNKMLDGIDTFIANSPNLQEKVRLVVLK